MNLELVTVGTELLLGFTVDTNAAEMAQSLSAVGVRVVRRATVGDDRAAIGSAVREALARTGVVIATGGLGPTRDDVTKKAVADLFGAPLELDTVYLEALRQRFERLRRGPMPEVNRTQAEVPRGATVLPNRWGTAPGLWLEGPPGIVILLPGVPREMRQLMAHEVVPRLGARVAGARVTRSRLLRTTGITESGLAMAIGDAEDRIAPVTLAYLPSVDGVDLRFTAWDAPPEEADRLLEDAAGTLKPILGKHCYGDGETDLAAAVLERLKAKGLRLAVAESCTGGLLGARITAIPGSSAVFEGGSIAYANQVKTRDLGVDAGVLAEHGAVSEPVVLAMAAGAAARFGVQAAVAITGIAGPDGGTPEKPVGTVWIAARLGDEERAVRIQWSSSREEVRQRAAQAGLDLLRRMMDGLIDG